MRMGNVDRNEHVTVEWRNKKFILKSYLGWAGDRETGTWS